MDYSKVRRDYQKIEGEGLKALRALGAPSRIAPKMVLVRRYAAMYNEELKAFLFPSERQQRTVKEQTILDKDHPEGRTTYIYPVVGYVTMTQTQWDSIEKAKQFPNGLGNYKDPMGQQLPKGLVSYPPQFFVKVVDIKEEERFAKSIVISSDAVAASAIVEDVVEDSETVAHKMEVANSDEELFMHWSQWQNDGKTKKSFLETFGITNHKLTKLIENYE